MSVLQPGSVALGYRQDAVTTVVNLEDVASFPSASYAVIVPETNGIRYRDDGTDPTASEGVPVAAGSALSYDGPLAKLRIVSQTGTSTVNIAYYSSRIRN